jgi:hypothetical protein
MGLLTRLRPSRTYGAKALALHAEDLVEVVGESYRQDVLRRVVTGDSSPYVDDLSGRARKIAETEQRRWFRAALVCEPDNEYDRNAVAVYADGVGRIGYLSRDDAADYQPVFRALRSRGCSTGSVPAFLIGGEPGKPSLGVLLCLSSPEKVIENLEASTTD